MEASSPELACAASQTLYRAAHAKSGDFAPIIRLHALAPSKHSILAHLHISTFAHCGACSAPHSVPCIFYSVPCISHTVPCICAKHHAHFKRFHLPLQGKRHSCDAQTVRHNFMPYYSYFTPIFHSIDTHHPPYLHFHTPLRPLCRAPHSMRQRGPYHKAR